MRGTILVSVFCLLYCAHACARAPTLTSEYRNGLCTQLTLSQARANYGIGVGITGFSVVDGGEELTTCVEDWTYISKSTIRRFNGWRYRTNCYEGVAGDSFMVYMSLKKIIIYLVFDEWNDLMTCDHWRKINNQ